MFQLLIDQVTRIARLVLISTVIPPQPQRLGFWKHNGRSTQNFVGKIWLGDHVGNIYLVIWPYDASLFPRQSQGSNIISKALQLYLSTSAYSLISHTLIPSSSSTELPPLLSEVCVSHLQAFLWALPHSSYLHLTGSLLEVTSTKKSSLSLTLLFPNWVRCPLGALIVPSITPTEVFTSCLSISQWDTKGLCLSHLNPSA